MARKRKKRVGVNRQAVLEGRAAGLSYRAIADKLSVDPSAVWRAERRAKGLEPREAPAGKQRCVYLPDELWAFVGERAKNAKVSRSIYLGRLLEAEREPRIEADS